MCSAIRSVFLVSWKEKSSDTLDVPELAECFEEGKYTLWTNAGVIRTKMNQICKKSTLYI